MYGLLGHIEIRSKLIIICMNVFDDVICKAPNWCQTYQTVTSPGSSNIFVTLFMTQASLCKL